MRKQNFRGEVTSQSLHSGHLFLQLIPLILIAPKSFPWGPLISHSWFLKLNCLNSILSPKDGNETLLGQFEHGRLLCPGIGAGTGIYAVRDGPGILAKTHCT